MSQWCSCAKQVVSDLRALGRVAIDSGQLVHGIHTHSSKTDWQEFSRDRDPFCIRSTTLHTGLGFVETYVAHGITASAQRAYFGRINSFLSYTWRGEGIDLFSLVDSLERIISMKGLDESKLFFFVDIFVCSESQNRNVHKEREHCTNATDVGKFEEVIRSCERLMFYCTPVTQPLTLGRSWCLFELMKADIHKIPIHVTFSEADEDKLMEFMMGIQNVLRNPAQGPNAWKCEGLSDLFTDIDAARAVATMPADKEMIETQIEQSVGFKTLNSNVSRLMRVWIKGTVEAFASKASKETPADVDLFDCVGNALYNIGHFAASQPYDETAVDIATRVLDPMDAITASSSKPSNGRG